MTMQSATSRLNTIVMFGGTLLFAISILYHIHGRFLYNPEPAINFQVTEIVSFRQLKDWDALSFKFNLDADLSSLYNWNLKQLYFYIEAGWEHEDKGKNLSNRMIISDWILESPDDRSKIKEAYTVSVKNRSIEYQVRDVYKQLKGKTIKISLKVEFMPTFGFFFKDTLKEIELQVPANYK